MLKWLNRILTKKYVPFVIRFFCLLVFLIFFLTLFYGSIRVLDLNLTSNIVMFILWTIWWPFLYLSLLFFARGWCGFLCPVSLANEAGNFLVGKKGRLLNFQKWGFFAYIAFFFIALWEQISGLFLSSKMSLIFLLGFFILAFLMGIIFKRWSFCAVVCPIGALLGVFSRLAFIGLRVDESICKSCKTKECLVGGKTKPCPAFNNVPNIDTNRHCLLCSNCIKNCPHNSAGIRFVRPNADLYKHTAFNSVESLFIIAVLGMLFILTTKGTVFIREIFMSLGLIEITGWLLRVLDFVFAIGLALLIFIVICRLSRTERITGYLYLPLAFLIMSFTVIFGFLGPYFLNELAIVMLKNLFLAIGALWSIYLAGKTIKNKGKYIHILLIIGIWLLWSFVLIQNEAPKEIYKITNEVVEMKAFSMGFTPQILFVDVGNTVDLNISNLDIIHAFDIDKFNVHRIISGGKTSRVAFTPNMTGEYEFYCSIPGHREAGMRGKLIVEEKENVI